MSGETRGASRSLPLVVALLVLGSMLGACTSSRGHGSGASRAAGVSSAAGSAPPSTAPAASSSTSQRPGAAQPTAAATTAPRARPAVAPASVHANELGLVPVLMYHQIVAKPGANRYNQTPAQFTAELQTLYAGGYVPITAADLVAGRVDIPAGKHPVVLTFDDSTVSQFGLTAAGEVKPGTAVALLLDFAATHPGFRPVATMYVNFAPKPFAGTDPAQGLRWLVDHGFEIGDHTLSHANLRSVGAAKAQQELVADLVAIEAAVPGYSVTTMALPFGVHPQPSSIAWSGSASGTSYQFAGVMEVGANPAHSPYSAAFDGTKVARIRSQSSPGADAPYESKHWLEWLRQHPAQLYTSDGDPTRIAYPRGSPQTVAAKYAARAVAY